MYFYFLVSLLSGFAFAEVPRTYRVWVDGIYDLAHYGHQRSFEKARAAAAKHFDVPLEQIEVLVGVNGGDIKSYKREPVMTLEQRVAQVSSFKGVDLVIPDAPLVFDRSYIDQYKLDLVMHGDDFSPEKAAKFYAAAIEKKIYQTYPYESGISTTQILKKATKTTLESMLEKNDLDCAQTKAIQQVLQLLDDAKI